MKNFIFAFFAIISFWMSPTLAGALSGPAPTDCAAALGRSSDLILNSKYSNNIFHGSIFVDPDEAAELYPSFRSLKQNHDLIGQFNPEKLLKMRSQIKAEAGYAVELFPLILKSEVANFLFAAAAQRATGANFKLKDIYPNSNPRILDPYPNLRAILDSSPLFAREIVGLPSAMQENFNFSLAMDVVLVENPDGTFSFAILESDSGHIGGIFRMAQVAQGLADIWPQANLFSDFHDSRTDLKARMAYESSFSSRYKDAPDGITVLFAELEGAFDQNKNTNVKKWLAENKIYLVSNYNKDKLIFNESEQRYYFEGKPVTNLWLSYNTEPLDPESPVFSRVAKSIREDAFERSHTLPGYWLRWHNGTYQRMRMNNPQGIEIFTDKAICAAIPCAERFYLGKEPLIGGNSYTTVWQGSDEATKKYIDWLYLNRESVVIKSRTESGQGKGVYVGPLFVGDYRKNGLDWDGLFREIRRDPVDYVVQPFLKEKPLVLRDGRQRTWEIRIITHFVDGVAHVMPMAYIRTSKVGTLRNMSGSKDRVDLDAPSIVPVLIPREVPVVGPWVIPPVSAPAFTN